MLPSVEFTNCASSALLRKLSLVLLFATRAMLADGQRSPYPALPSAPPGTFADVTASSGVTFRYRSSHTAKKFLPETMGAGVALFDYDNDGHLDIFFVNGAPLSDSTSRGTIPQKTGPQYWNRLY